MSTSITFLSGKGVSGKTTLALSMADLLCRCKVKILLIDCDLSTNGATYFYESQLADRDRSKPGGVYSFYDLLNTEIFIDEIFPLKIEKNLDFLPSISAISDQYMMEELVVHGRDYKTKVKLFLDLVQQYYDVILFDCQAGYTELLSALLPLVDIDLFVLEADSISASAMRSLHLKIGNALGHARLYQIFNKATSEEFEIYSKIVGTFFTNIGTLLFDWKIRQAFSRSQIPDLENTSANYGMDLCNINKIILTDKTIQEKLEHFLDQLHYRKLDDERKEIEEKLYKLPTRSPLRKIVPTLYISSVGILVFASLAFELISEQWINLRNQSLITSTYGVLLGIMLGVALGIFTYKIINTDKFQGSATKRQKYERRLKELDRELKKINHLKLNKEEN